MARSRRRRGILRGVSRTCAAHRIHSVRRVDAAHAWHAVGEGVALAALAPQFCGCLAPLCRASAVGMLAGRVGARWLLSAHRILDPCLRGGRKRASARRQRLPRAPVAPTPPRHAPRARAHAHRAATYARQTRSRARTSVMPTQTSRASVMVDSSSSSALPPLPSPKLRSLGRTMRSGMNVRETLGCFFESVGWARNSCTPRQLSHPREGVRGQHRRCASALAEMIHSQAMGI